MKYITVRPFADPETAAHKLLEIANATEAVQDGRIYIELINQSFLDAGASPDEYWAASTAPLPTVGCGDTSPEPM